MCMYKIIVRQHKDSTHYETFKMDNTRQVEECIEWQMKTYAPEMMTVYEFDRKTRKYKVIKKINS